ncbi:trypsin-like peptidase domain-containing protein [Myxococcota bacterium]|nr:trypsin-like peptidase domain-containing protein [Myxococcota bacterium]
MCREDCSLDAIACVFEEITVGHPEECATSGECAGVGNIIDEVDWIDTRELEEGPRRERARASGRISFREGGVSSRCSATLIDDDLLITNHHCAPDAEVASTVRFYPTSEKGVSSYQQQLDSFTCPELVATDCAHDVSLLRCQPHATSGELPGELHGVVPLLLDAPQLHDEIYVIHTNCDFRDRWCTPYKLLSPGVITRFGGECISFSGEPSCGNCRSDTRQARHNADTLGGSSGGGVFDAAEHALIGLNWGGISREDNTGGWNYTASLADLVEYDEAFAQILLPLVNREPPAPLTPSEQIAAARGLQRGTRLIEGAWVTYIVPEVGSSSAGFIIQAARKGPALFVEAVNAGVEEGDLVSVVITEVESQDGRAHAVAWRDLRVLERGEAPELVQPLAEAGALEDQIEEYDLEILGGALRIAGDFRPAGGAFEEVPITVEGSEDAGALTLRLPRDLRARLTWLQEGARFTAPRLPLWRYRDKAQLGAWYAEDLTPEIVPEPEPTPEPAPEPEPEPEPEPTPEGACLIISEYVEGSAYNKAIEIYNCGAELSLSRVGVCLETNASSVCSRQILLEGVLAPGGLFTLCNSGISAGLLPAGGCDLSENSVSNFNGDDRLALFLDKDGSGRFEPERDTILDVFGALGGVPSGRPWANLTLRRCDLTPASGEEDVVFERFSSHPQDDLSHLGRAPEPGCAP